MPVHDRGQLAALALERLAQACSAERDSQLVPGQLRDADAVGIRVAPSVAHRQRRIVGASSDNGTALAPAMPAHQR